MSYFIKYSRQKTSSKYKAFSKKNSKSNNFLRLWWCEFMKKNYWGKNISKKGKTGGQTVKRNSIKIQLKLNFNKECEKFRHYIMILDTNLAYHCVCFHKNSHRVNISLIDHQTICNLNFLQVFSASFWKCYQKYIRLINIISHKSIFL